MRRTLLTVALSVVIAAPAAAQQPLKLSFQDGRVTIDATGVPVRTILNEWSRIGGTKVVGAERITGSPLTVKLVNVTEAQALETILRSAAGYMAAPRNGATTGPSIYDRILVMATSSAPAAASAARPAPPQPNALAGTQRFVPPRQRPEQAEQDEADEPDENPPSPPVFTFPQPAQQNGFPQPGTFTNAPQSVSQPGMQVPAPSTITINPAQPAAPAQPTRPIGVAQPGMMVPAPQPAPPGMIRPPGGRD
jgi:hypothetical protein